MTIEHLKVNANVIKQLGEQLITDAEQALLELIKNSYDADSETCDVVIDSGLATASEGANEIAFPLGSIRIEDTGHGMNLATIRDGWLVVSLSSKKLMKEQGLVTAKFKRTPLGDKGLGRLGTMKLGRNIELVTYTSAETEGYRVALCWDNFSQDKTLDQVDVTVEKVPARGKEGTILTIRGLAEPKYWQGEHRLKHLERKAVSLVSPFKKINSFQLRLRVDGQDINLEEVTSQIRASATLTVKFSWDDDCLEWTGSAKLDLFRSNRSDSSEFFDSQILPDRGAKFLEFMQQASAAQQYQPHSSNTKGWFVSFGEKRTWSKIQGVNPDLAKPGPFNGEIDSFEFDAETNPTAVFSDRKSYKNYVKEHSGIYVYRDGFGLRMAEDWAGLGKQWTSGKSYYSLRPSNTLGFIEISALSNPLLKETTDREGFIDTPESRGFHNIVLQVIASVNGALAAFRRAFNEYRELETERQVNPHINERSHMSPPEMVAILQDLQQDKKKRQRELEEKSRQRDDKIRELEKKLQDAASNTTLFSENTTQISDSINKLSELKEDIGTEQKALNDLLARGEKPMQIAAAALQRADRLHEQLSDVIEHAGVGIAAQALAHDINSILDDLLARIQRVSNLVKATSKNAQMAEVGSQLSTIPGIVNNLRKQVGFLSPMMRSARELRQEFDVSKFVSDYFELRNERLKSFSIVTYIEAINEFQVRMNKGRLLQVIDNLVRNSEYWLRQSIMQDSTVSAEIHVNITSPQIVIWDTGQGIDPSVEDCLFEPFVSTKPRTESLGSGLGLFIASQLLDREGCSIVLASERNRHGNRYKFIISLEGVIRHVNQ